MSASVAICGWSRVRPKPRSSPSLSGSVRVSCRSLFSFAMRVRSRSSRTSASSARKGALESVQRPRAGADTGGAKVGVGPTMAGVGGSCSPTALLGWPSWARWPPGKSVPGAPAVGADASTMGVASTVVGADGACSSTRVRPSRTSVEKPIVTLQHHRRSRSPRPADRGRTQLHAYGAGPRGVPGARRPPQCAPPARAAARPHTSDP